MELRPNPVKVRPVFPELIGCALSVEGRREKGGHGLPKSQSGGRC